MWSQGRPTPGAIAKAQHLLESGEHQGALNVLGGGCYGAGYDPEYFELLGRALLGAGQESNAGRFLFLSGIRRSEYWPAICRFLSQNHNPLTFRQLHSQFPARVRSLGHLRQFPPVVARELRRLGFPDDIQGYFVRKKERRLRR